MRVKATVLAELFVGGKRARFVISAVAEAAPPASSAGSSSPAMASGGGYSGPLVYRQGEGMRPDVAGAFDRMAAAASGAGIALIVNSAFRSDAEQAALFAAHPDPRWVAPPGQSLHRCATELDLGPDSAYGWLAANASRFGFVQRYSWVLHPVSVGRAGRGLCVAPERILLRRSSKSRGQGDAGAEGRRGDGARLDGKGDFLLPLSSARCLTRTFVLDHAVDPFGHGPAQSDGSIAWARSFGGRLRTGLPHGQ